MGRSRRPPPIERLEHFFAFEDSLEPDFPSMTGGPGRKTLEDSKLLGAHIAFPPLVSTSGPPVFNTAIPIPRVRFFFSFSDCLARLGVYPHNRCGRLSHLVFLRLSSPPLRVSFSYFLVFRLVRVDPLTWGQMSSLPIFPLGPLRQL